MRARLDRELRRRSPRPNRARILATARDELGRSRGGTVGRVAQAAGVVRRTRSGDYAGGPRRRVGL
ncbi:hypothetical protein PYK79_29450, partial [Streptomyces sp. ID05-04B]|nr:hypothetical protein [Streptomyces sp. ID05-04B]